MRALGGLACVGLSVASVVLAGCGGPSHGQVTPLGPDSGTHPDAPDAGSDGGAGAGSDGGAGAGSDGGADASATLTPRFVTAPRTACTFSAPMAITSQGQAQVLLVTADGTFSALDPATGDEIWHLTLPAPDGAQIHLAAPPVAIDGRHLVFVWQDVLPDWTRVNHHVGVLDLEVRQLDPEFPPLTLTASKPAFGGAGTVDFVPAHAYARSALAHARLPGHALGLIYASYGNVRDLQPFHGWVFEVDLDEWKSQGPTAAVTASLVTTADTSCGAENGDGARQMMCGGSVWSHRGPQVVYDDDAPDGFALIVPTGNGLLDPTRGDFANSVMRTGHGLRFDPGCDLMMCESFDPRAPGEACMASCENLFMPRLLSGQTMPEGAGRVCVGRTFLECYAALDWDLGASAPAIVALPGGPQVILQPGKDGSLYLLDANHLGTLYDRLPIMAGCGEGGGNCIATWAGTIATRPEIVTVDGAVLALVPTFVLDDAHPAGLQAVEISVAGGSPHLISRWQAPRFTDPESVSGFRHHAGGVTIVDVGGEPYAAVVDTAGHGQIGKLYWVRVRDGAIIQRVTLKGAGQRFAPPLVSNGTLYVPSCEHTGLPDFNEGPSHVEAFSISAP